MVLTGTDAQTVRPYKGLHVRCVRCVVRCIKGYSIVVLTGTDALPLNTLRASLQRVTRLIVTRQVCPLYRPLYQRLQHRGFNGDVHPPTKHSPCVPTAGCTSSCYTLECYLEPVAADL